MGLFTLLPYQIIPVFFFLDQHEDNNNNLSSKLFSGFETCLFFRIKFQITYPVNIDCKSFCLVTDEMCCSYKGWVQLITLDGSYTLKHLQLIRDANQSPIGTIRPVFQNVYSQKLKRGLGICPTETLRPSLAKAWSIQFHLTENVMRLVALTVIRLNCIVAFFSQCWSLCIVYSWPSYRGGKNSLMCLWILVLKIGSLIGVYLPFGINPHF